MAHIDHKNNTRIEVVDAHFLSVTASAGRCRLKMNPSLSPRQEPAALLSFCLYCCSRLIRKCELVRSLRLILGSLGTTGRFNDPYAAERLKNLEKRAGFGR
jgi:hypothetical protein